MADMIQQLKQAFSAALARAFGDDYADADPMLGPANNPKFGDYQANLAMKLREPLGKPSREIAQAVVDQLETGGLVEKVEIAGPGFINLHLSSSALAAAALAMFKDDRFGVALAESPQTVVVDYSSPNVAKEMHVGHLRSTVIGDAIARVLTFQGHDVIRQNHLGDWGTQFGRIVLAVWYEALVTSSSDQGQLEDWLAQTNEPGTDWDALAEAVAVWHNQLLAQDESGQTSLFKAFLGDPLRFPHLTRLDLLYTFVSKLTASEAAQRCVIRSAKHGEMMLRQLPSFIASMVQQHEKPENQEENLAWLSSRKISIDACQAVYDRMGVSLKPEHVRGESFYSGVDPDDPVDRLASVIDDLDAAGHLAKSDGALVVETPGFTDRDGNPLPFMVRKSDRGYLYGTTDIAAARYRIEDLDAQRLIYVVGSPQRLHFDMLFATLRHVGWDKNVGLDFVGFGNVLGADGKKLSSRSGGAVRLAELLDEAEQRATQIVREKNAERGEVIGEEEVLNLGRVIGMGSIKYADLSSDRIKDYVFDWSRMLSFEGNTAPYLINAYVRVHGIFRKGEIDFDSFNAGYVQVEDPAEKALVLKLIQFGATIDSVVESLEPHRLCNFLYELASAFHKFFESCPVLRSDVPDDVRQGRLALCKLVARTLKQGMDLLGIGVVDRM
ncbi:MAG: arginine--tRNA ligase [Planctomycetota bacterium]